MTAETELLADRRQPARVEFTDGNGLKSTSYNLTLQRHKMIFASVAALLGVLISVGTVSCGAIKFGLSTSIQEAIDTSITPPDGKVHRHMCEVAQSYDHTLAAEVREEVDQVENSVIELTTQQKELVKSIDRMIERSHRIADGSP